MIPSFLHDFVWICYNGAWIELQGNVLYQTAIPVEDAREIVARIQSTAAGLPVGSRNGR